ncbi:MAG: efflux transporter outer membrane subunit [Sulfurifustis sp.]
MRSIPISQGFAGVAAAALLLAACAVGPDYTRPAVDVPAGYKEAQGWKPAQPRDDALPGKWWDVFGDAQLDALMQQVDVSNQNLKIAEARFRQARALIGSARAAYFPDLAASASVTRNRNRNANVQASSTNYNLALDSNWEIDIWGRVRRSVEANVSATQASAADLQAARLSAQAQLAQAYFSLRVQDAVIALLKETVAANERSVQLTQNQYDVGVAPRSDVTQALTQLKSVQAQMIDAGVQRAQLEHAIALLIGKAPLEFSVVPAALNVQIPATPAGLPSDLLERRPDIAGAERRVATANAQIGVARAAYFPALTLTAAGGYQSASAANWFSVPNRFWSVGAALAETLFDGGLREAQNEAAVAAYDETVATYRQTVLAGFQEVEDNLAALRILEEEARVQEEAVKAARESLALVTNQYRAGVVSYLNVVVVQTATFNNERTALAILNQRLTASIALIRALGGGWSAMTAENGADPRR